MTMQEFINGLPQVELHVHIEGMLKPEMKFCVAARNHVILTIRPISGAI